MANTYLDQILQGQNQRQITGRGRLTANQVESAFQGDISARYQAEAKNEGVALQDRQLALQEKSQAETMAFNRDQLAAQQKTGQTQSIVSGVGAIGQAALLYKMYGSGIKDTAGNLITNVGNKISGTTSPAVEGTSLAAGAAGAGETAFTGATSGTSLAPETAFTFGGAETPAYGSGMTFTGNTGAYVGEGATYTSGASIGSAVGTIGSAASTAVPYIAAAKIGMPTLGRTLSQITPGEPDSSNVFQQGATITKEDYMDPIEAISKLGPAPIPDWAGAVFNPGGALMKALGCIIITACTSPDSPEVNIARKYRNEHMDKMELRGYYIIAEKIVPLMLKHSIFKKFIKKTLVNGIIDYCEYAIGERESLPRKWSAFVTKSFLGLCGYVGSQKEKYVRINGEVF